MAVRSKAKCQSRMTRQQIYPMYSHGPPGLPPKLWLQTHQISEVTPLKPSYATKSSEKNTSGITFEKDKFMAADVDKDHFLSPEEAGAPLAPSRLILSWLGVKCVHVWLCPPGM